MNLDELRSVQAKERRKDSLQHLRDAFYDDVAAYINDLRAARDRRAEQVEKPFSDDDVRRMSDEIETAEEVAEALYERRVGKVVKLASFAAADMPVESEGMTSQERELFDDLVARIGENKATVLDVLSGDAPPAAREATGPAADPPDDDAGPVAAEGDSNAEARTDAAPPSSEGSPPDTVADGTPTAEEPSHPSDGGSTADDTGALADAMGGDSPETPTESSGDRSAADRDPAASDANAASDTDPTPVSPEPAPPGAPGVDDTGSATSSESDPDTGSTPGSDAGTDRTTVKITQDVGRILGVDEREYDLASEDVVTLPAENAAPLVQREAAERID